MRRWLVATVCLLLPACSGLQPQADYTGLAVAPVRELRDTPFFPQEDYQCGPAALAMALHQQGVAIPPMELTPLVYLPAREGSLPDEMRVAPAHYGLLGVRIQPSLAALLQLLSAGRPVVVLQNFGLASRPVWHYAVAIGYDLEQRRVYLRSGTRERVSYSFPVFLKTWSRAGFWGLVVLRPDDLPTEGVAPTDYLAAAAALERQQRLHAARTAYLAATRRWPDNALAWAGAGNSAYALGQPAAADAAYRRALALEPANHLVMNNLALALAQRGCLARAREVLECARRLAPADAALAATRKEINSFAGTGAACAPVSCPPAAD